MYEFTERGARVVMQNPPQEQQGSSFRVPVKLVTHGLTAVVTLTLAWFLFRRS